MKPKSDLFDLVKRLSKNEKRYVTLFLSTTLHGGNTNSLQLFRAVSKQKTYDEAQLKKQLSKSIVSRFSAEKNKLFELILDSMLLYYRDTPLDKKAVNIRYHAVFLFQKQLRTPAWRYFHKAETLAGEYEMLLSQIALAYYENIEIRRSSKGEAPFDPEKYYARNAKLVAAVADDLTLHTIFTEIIELEKRYGTVSESREAAAQLERIIRHPLLDRSRKSEAFSSKMLRLEIHAVYHTMRNEEQPAYDCFREEVALLETKRSNIEQNYGRYCDALLNLIQHAIRLRDYETFRQQLGKARAVLQGLKKYVSMDVAYLDFTSLQKFELMAYIYTQDTDRGPAFLAHYEKQFRQYRSQMKVHHVIGISFLIGTYHFQLGNLKKALAAFNHLIDDTSTDVAQNYQCMVRVIKVLLHYDLGHADLLPSLVATATRLLRKQGRFGKTEQVVLGFFGKHSGPVSKAQWKQLLAAVKKSGTTILKYGSWCEFDLEDWITAKTK